jgi:organic radical activating enzyme
MFHLPYAEFYITNVCNLNCENCNRFNNFHFRGHLYWDDHKSEYQKWAKLVNIDEIGILGGEPLLNPDLLKWIQGVSELWPTSKLKLITNGTRLLQTKNLYEVISQVKSDMLLEVNCHNLSEKTQLIENIKQFLDADVIVTYENTDKNYSLWKKSYRNIMDKSWPSCDTPEQFYTLPDYIQKECIELHDVSPETHHRKHTALTFIDKNQVHACLRPAGSFLNSTLMFDQNNKTLHLHKNNPDKSIEVCYSKGCHHFIGGKLYKCGPVALLPEFVKQFAVVRDEEQDKLIHGYQPASPDWSQSSLNKFVQDLIDKKPIPQCSLCPDKMTNFDYVGTTKKIKITRID